MRRWMKLVLAVVILVAVAAAGWLILHACDPTEFADGARVDLADYHGPDPTGVPAFLAGADPATRGQYLTRAADCVACHTARGGKPFASGRAFKLPFWHALFDDITPDIESGIGGWSDEDFVRALHEGIGKDGEHLYPAFPYPSFTLLTRSDVLAIKRYLFNLKPVRNVPPTNDISFPFNQRYLMGLWNLLFNPGQRFRPNIGQPPEWNRGEYLAEALGHCGDRHTPRNLLQGLSSRRKFAGTVIEGWQAYNITPDPAWGIGDWSDPQFADYLSTGHAPGRGSAAGPMGEAVDDSLRFPVKDDISALMIYLRSVPSIGDSKEVAAVRALPTQIAATNTPTRAKNGSSLGCPPSRAPARAATALMAAARFGR